MGGGAGSGAGAKRRADFGARRIARRRRHQPLARVLQGTGAGASRYATRLAAPRVRIYRGSTSSSDARIAVFRSGR